MEVQFTCTALDLSAGATYTWEGEEKLADEPEPRKQIVQNRQGETEGDVKHLHATNESHYMQLD